MPFFFGRKHKEPPKFINIPLLDPSKTQVYNLYTMVNLPPINIDVFEKSNMMSPNRGLYSYAVNLLKNAIYALYHVPIIRQYYGKEFVHGISAKYDETRNEIQFINMDDTDEAIEYTKELTHILEIMLQEVLVKYDMYVYYQGEAIQIITGDEYRKMAKKVLVDNRIIWVE